MPQNPPSPGTTNAIRMEPIGKFKQNQNGNVHTQEIVEGNNIEPLVKVSIATGPRNVEAVVWRRGQLVMSEQDVDEIAFLTGTHYTTQITQSICQSSSLIYNACDVGGVTGTESPTGPAKKSLYEKNGVAACTQKRALYIATIVFALLFTVSVIIAYTGPQGECSCAGMKPTNYVDDEWNETKVYVPRATNGQIFPWSNIRLPTFIIPTRYNITIHPNLTTLEVKGQVSIEFYVEKDVQFLILHSKNLTITEKLVQDRKGHSLRVTKILEYLGGQQIYIEIKDKFRKRSNYTINLRYITKLSKDYQGFYVSSYKNNDGERRYLATTHFEPTYARAAFPCFDEPQFKARFKMSIFRDRFHIALFNMPVVNTEDVGFYMGTGLLRDDFQESVEMSTYLVAFVICDYVHLNKQTEKGVSISVYTPPPFISQASFALETAIHMMDFFENFFGEPYPLPKQDLVAIPDFTSGAMENWGLITYRENALLYDPHETSTAAHQWVAIVVTHEISHQWFGNIVTMKWWNDLWLNEGFASYLEYVGVNDFKPEWKMMDQFILDKTQPALALDALVSSHPITVTVRDPAEIEALFDTISYSKGAAIIYMMANFLQEESLQNGLNDYLNTFKYGNAETKDLWKVLSMHTNQSLDVKSVMETWTNQMGFPLITISREGSTIIATQERFLLTIESANSTLRSMPKSKYEYKWFVPLTYITNIEPKTTVSIWLNMTDAHFEIEPEARWIKANINQTGFYRVMYDDSIWASIISDLHKNHKIFSAADRANLIDDAFTLSRAGLLNGTLPLELSLYLMNERDYVPWVTALGHFQSWSRKLSESLAYKLFLKYLRKLLTPIVQYVGWSDKGSHLGKLLRTDVLASAVLCELNSTVIQAKSKFQLWMTKNESIHPDLKEVVYSAGIQYGGTLEWQYCWSVYNSTNIPSEKILLLQALGVATDPWLLQRYLLETLDITKIKPQDAQIVLSVVAANPEGRLLAWRHLKAYWPTMQKLFGNSTFMMGNLISAVTAHLSTPYDYYEVSTYFNGMDVGAATRALEQSLEIIKLNINWVSQNAEDVYTWLLDHVK